MLKILKILIFVLLIINILFWVIFFVPIVLYFIVDYATLSKAITILYSNNKYTGIIWILFLICNILYFYLKNYYKKLMQTKILKKNFFKYKGRS
jgi:hypothetical protein